MDPILGQIILWPVQWVPAGWQLCDGTLLNVQNYQALFSLIGNTYGGDGDTTFAVPDLRSKVPLGTTTMTAVAQVGGSETSSIEAEGSGLIALTINNLPAHSHAATFNPNGGSATASVAIPAVSGTTATTDIPGTGVSLAKTTGPAADIYSTATPDTTLAPFKVTVPSGGGTVTVGNTGNGQAVPVIVNVPVTLSVMQPYLTLNYIIALEGIYPSRP